MISYARFVEIIRQGFDGRIFTTNDPDPSAPTTIVLSPLENNNNNSDTMRIDLENGMIPADRLQAAIDWINGVATENNSAKLTALGVLGEYAQGRRTDSAQLLTSLGFSEVFDRQSKSDIFSDIFTASGDQVGTIPGGEKASQGQLIDAVVEAVAQQWVRGVGTQQGTGRTPTPFTFSRQAALIAKERMNGITAASGPGVLSDQKLAGKVKGELNYDTLLRVYSLAVDRLCARTFQPLRVADLRTAVQESGIPNGDVIPAQIFGETKLQVVSGQRVLAVISYNSASNFIDKPGDLRDLVDHLGNQLDGLKAQAVFKEALQQKEDVDSFVDIRWVDPWDDLTEDDGPGEGNGGGGGEEEGSGQDGRNGGEGDGDT